MDLPGENLDFVKLLNVKGNVENITPHKIAVIAFIREYGLLKMEAKEMVDCTMAPKYRKDFCILALKLIQCPDMEFKELEALLTDGRYSLLSVHLQNFCVRLQNIYVNGITALMDCVTSTMDKLVHEPNGTYSCITRSSVLGFYLRRVVLYMDKMSFVQIVSLYKSFCLYYQRGRPGLMIRSLSLEKLNNMEQQASASGVLPEDSKNNELSMRLNIVDRDNTFEECRWSRKQAELFTAQQAIMLQINEKKAMPPRQLQKTIIQIMNDIPDYADVHFLSFLNCIRMKEFCGAQDSLYNCFDRTVFSAPGTVALNSEKNKNSRYAALNRAAMHTQFGHKEMAMECVREVLATAQEAGDGACLAHAAAWGALAGGRVRRAALLARAPRAPRAAAAAALLKAQHAALNAAKPADVFHIITKGDSINYLHSMTDLTMASLATTAALWSLYGNTEMASVTCQLLLNLNTKSSTGNLLSNTNGDSRAAGGVWYWTEASAAAAAGALCVAAWRGHGALVTALAAHFPAPTLHSAATRHHASAALFAGKWEEADQYIRQLASFDRWESQLLRGEMYFLKGDPTDAIEALQDILQYCNTEDDSLHFISLRLKAMILMSEVQHSFSGIQSSDILLLNEALALAKKYHMHYLAATAEMHIANIQLNMGRPKNAVIVARKVLPMIMAHGSSYDMARALLLYTKCVAATAPAAGEARAQVLAACADALHRVRQHFQALGATLRLLHACYLQAQIYNDIGNIVARNQCAWAYRQLETQNLIEPSKILLTMY